MRDITEEMRDGNISILRFAEANTRLLFLENRRFGAPIHDGGPAKEAYLEDGVAISRAPLLLTEWANGRLIS